MRKEIKVRKKGGKGKAESELSQKVGKIETILKASTSLKAYDKVVLRVTKTEGGQLDRKGG